MERVSRSLSTLFYWLRPSQKLTTLMQASAFTLATGFVGAAWAASPWTAVGSTGVVDEADAAEVNFSSGVAQISGAAPASSSVTLRYNVTAIADLDNGGVNKRLSARFRDNGSDARVVLSLRQYNYNSGLTTTLLTLDSNTRPANAAYQTHSVSDGCWTTSFDFSQNAYFIEAVLTRTSTAGSPGLAILRVEDADLC
ncbi:hypothetical protein EUZ85_03645 [Hahella sp. KA22]|uniref:hypothetical protein n=2 Tax=Hahella sp. KA22 TaxID=1628392 RepID=UPI000FDD9C00|nr:hypothetical protein [Hahella sp. KA22]AZZ89850.1 hypothetical protein ENC22_01100 [Hahella sp. KA22]QAY53219.1 hypothetical protein EUZ85_03645 [Hahella sp. KA22]